MAADWIKFDVTTHEKPEVVTMAELLETDEDTIVGKLLRLWVWADQQSLNGNGLSVTEKWVDAKTGQNGFSKAMRKVGWLRGRSGNLTFPNFDRHNGQTAKNRAVTNRRVSKHRNGDVTPEPLQKSLPEKRREDISTPLNPPKGGGGREAPGEKPAKPRREQSPQKRIWALKEQASALEAQAKEIWDKHASECAMETEWTTPEHRAEYHRLKRAAKEKRAEIAKIDQ